jgi:hypothetical protein
MDSNDPFKNNSSSVISASQPDSLVFSIISSKPSSSSKSTKYIDYKENQAGFTLEPPEKSTIYVFKHGLYSRTLLPIDPSKKRQMEVRCTM